MVKLTPTKMGRAKAMRDKDMSLRKIAGELQVSYEAVRQRLSAADTRHHLYPHKPPGTPGPDARLARQIHRSLVLDPWRSYRLIAKDYAVGPKAVAKVAASNFLFRLISKRKPYLTRKARQDRLAWIPKAAEADWSSVIWTDESLVRIGDRGRKWVTRPRGEADSPLYVTPTIRQGKRVMIWGAISYGRKYPLVKIDLGEGTFNKQRYLDEILKPHLANHVRYLRRYGQQHVTVVEDGAPVHGLQSLERERRQMRIKNFPHPAHSPDLNPIENLWAIVKYRLRNRWRTPTSEEELWEAIQEEWDRIPIGTVNKLIEGMPKRVEKLRRSKGFGISY